VQVVALVALTMTPAVAAPHDAAVADVGRPAFTLPPVSLTVPANATFLYLKGSRPCDRSHEEPDAEWVPAFLPYGIGDRCAEPHTQ
jgi:hypothetical protein